MILTGADESFDTLAFVLILLALADLDYEYRGAMQGGLFAGQRLHVG